MNDLSARKREVASDFDLAAKAYDRLAGMNPGYHRHLRRSAAHLVVPSRARILDLCCGTGLSTEALRAVHPRAQIIALDASRGMLDVARQKSVLRGVELLHGDAMDPRAAGVEGELDAIFMAYGIRNVPGIDLCLERLYELLAPGGTICFHEYSVRDSWRARATWDAVCWGIIVPGGLATGSGARIYRYLHESVRAFDGVRAFEQRLARTGFVDVRTEPMDGWQRGILHSFLAERPRPIGVAE